MRVGASGVVRAGTGIGVLQRAIYPRLESRGFQLRLSENRDLGSGRFRAALGLARGLRPAPGFHDAYLSAVPPLPFGTRASTVTIVHDLRWQETRRGLARAYRKWDLARSVKRSTQLLCISDRTRQDLLGMFPAAAPKARVAWLGPGIAEAGDSFSNERADRETGLCLLIGGAPHKKNERAAQALALHTSAKITRVAGVGVSIETRAIVDAAPHLSGEWHSGISDSEMRTLYQRAEYFMLLGTNEGFGMPFIEGLASGCVVVAADHQLARELLGDAALYLSGGTATEIAAEIDSLEAPPLNLRLEVAARYSWDAFADAVSSALTEAAQQPRPRRTRRWKPNGLGSAAPVGDI